MVSLVPETLFKIGQFPITNTVVDIVIVDTLLIAGAVIIKKNISKVPGALQNIVELLVETFYDLTESIADKRASDIFPYFMTFFLFILITNLSGLIPGVGTIGFWQGKKEFVPLVKSGNSDLNVTLSLAIVSAVATHILSLKTIGIKSYLKRYFSLNPINLFVGLLEIVGEFTKVISLSFRLFGNIFAGEVLIAVISSFLPYLLPVPLMLFETFVGLLQAAIFALLTLVFIKLAIMEPHSTGSGQAHGESHSSASAQH